MLPTKVKSQLRLHWYPIFKMMEKGLDNDVRDRNVDADYLSSSFSIGRDYLKTRVSYVFENPKCHQDTWGISTWSKKVSRSTIEKQGNDNDKSKLEPATAHMNRPRQQNGRRRPLADRRRVRQRIRAPAAAAVSVEDDNDYSEDDFNENEQQQQQQQEQAALPDLTGQLCERARERGREIERQVLNEVQREQQVQEEEARRISRNGRPDGDGGLLFFSRGSRQS